MKKILAALVASAFAVTLYSGVYSAQASACPGHEKTTVTKKEKKEGEEQVKEQPKKKEENKEAAPKAPAKKKVS